MKTMKTSSASDELKKNARLNRKILPLAMILKEELMRRQAKNKNYSLRAFAQFLSLSPSFLSKVLNGQKGLSKNSILKICSRINSEDPLRSDILKMSASLSHKLGETQSKESFTLIDSTRFEMIANWEHYAILELTTLKEFKDNPKWISKKIGISETRADLALKRLLDLHLLERNKKTKKINSTAENNSSLTPQSSSLAQREHERQLLSKAIEALEKISFEKRSQTSIKMAIPQNRVAEAKQRIIEFQREFMNFMQRKGERDSVYNLSISFFPLTESE